MTAAALQADFSQFRGLQTKIDRLVGLMGNELPEGIGTILETSGRRRIRTTKVGPDGTPWPEWSRAYALRRPAGKSLLSDSGSMEDSLDNSADRDQVVVFAAAEQAASHQFGDDRVITVGNHQQKRNIPARPFLGLGDEDVEQIELLIDNLAEQGLRV